MFAATGVLCCWRCKCSGHEADDGAGGCDSLVVRALYFTGVSLQKYGGACIWAHFRTEAPKGRAGAHCEAMSPDACYYPQDPWKAKWNRILRLGSCKASIGAAQSSCSIAASRQRSMPSRLRRQGGSKERDTQREVVWSGVVALRKDTTVLHYWLTAVIDLPKTEQWPQHWANDIAPFNLSIFEARAAAREISHLGAEPGGAEKLSADSLPPGSGLLNPSEQSKHSGLLAWMRRLAAATPLTSCLSKCILCALRHWCTAWPVTRRAPWYLA